VFLVVAAAALYVLLPGLVSVFSSWRSLEHLDWPFAVLVVVLEIASWVCLWNLDRIALGVSGWFAVACAQLAGNALGRIVPGSATPSTVVMLRRAGLDGGDAAAALTASTLLQIGTALARCALRAVGASPRPSLVMLAYASAELLAQIPLTPGGLGFVEAGLVGTLTVAGVPGPAALAATLLYRLVSYWLPLPVGGLAYLAFRRRYGTAPRAAV
jgi:uncharacterized membrane protein YbhN (UPF0104 family)